MVQKIKSVQHKKDIHVGLEPILRVSDKARLKPVSSGSETN